MLPTHQQSEDTPRNIGGARVVRIQAHGNILLVISDKDGFDGSGESRRDDIHGPCRCLQGVLADTLINHRQKLRRVFPAVVNAVVELHPHLVVDGDNAVVLVHGAQSKDDAIGTRKVSSRTISILAGFAAVDFHVFVVLDAVGKHFTDRSLRKAGCRTAFFRNAQLPDIDDLTFIAFLQDVNTPTAGFRKTHDVVSLFCFGFIAKPNPQHLIFFWLGDFIRPDDYAFCVERLRCYRKEVAVFRTDKSFCGFHDFVTVLHSDGDSVALRSPKVVGVCLVVGEDVGHFPSYRDGTEELCFQAVFPGNHASHVCRRGGNGDISVAFSLNRELAVLLNDFLICRSEGLIVEDGASFIEQNEGGSLSVFVRHCGGDELVLERLFRVPCLEELVSGIERRRLAQVTTEREHRVLHGEVCSGFARAAHVAKDVLSRIAEEIRDRRARAGTANRNLKHHAAILLVVSAEGKDVVNAAVVVQLHGKMGFRVRPAKGRDFAFILIFKGAVVFNQR